MRVEKNKGSGLIAVLVVAVALIISCIPSGGSTPPLTLQESAAADSSHNQEYVTIFCNVILKPVHSQFLLDSITLFLSIATYTCTLSPCNKSCWQFSTHSLCLYRLAALKGWSLKPEAQGRRVGVQDTVRDSNLHVKSQTKLVAQLGTLADTHSQVVSVELCSASSMLTSHPIHFTTYPHVHASLHVPVSWWYRCDRWTRQS